MDWLQTSALQVGVGPGVLLGGALIGLAAVLLALTTGRSMAPAAMVASLLGGAEGAAAVSIAFVGGLVLAPTLLLPLGRVAATPAETGLALPLLGGALVGLGIRIGGASTGGQVLLDGARRPAQALLSGLCMFVAGAAVVFAERQGLLAAVLP